MRTTITTTIETPLCCKELASELSVLVFFIYKMRSAGFEMRWDSDMRCEAATSESARRWIKKTKFRVVRGWVQKGCKSGRLPKSKVLL